MLFEALQRPKDLIKSESEASQSLRVLAEIPDCVDIGWRLTSFD